MTHRINRKKGKNVLYGGWLYAHDNGCIESIEIYRFVKAMPSSSILCVVYGKKDRYVRSKYTKICTIERKEKIREGYRLRRKKELRFSLLNHQEYFKKKLNWNE
jgi:hypothetical protein